MYKVFRMFVTALTLVYAFSLSAQEDPQKIYVFGNSLINHTTGSDETTVPHWLAHFAAQSDVAFALDGQFGLMLRESLEKPIEPQWSFRNVKRAWEQRRATFESVGYSTILVSPPNFVQYLKPDVPHDWDNPKGYTPISASVALLDRVGTDKRMYIYEGWSDMANYGYPPSKRKLRRYHRENQSDYHDWYVDLVAGIQIERPQADVSLIPVAYVLSQAFTETELSGIPLTDLYSDDAPHGTATLYFLAAAVTYAAMFDEMPKLGALPATVHPLVTEHFDTFLELVRQALPENVTAAAPSSTSSEAAELPTETTANAAAPEQPTAAEFVLTGAPTLGMGLNGIADWSVQMPFIDLMKSARPWTGHLPDQWGGWEHKDLEEGGYLDTSGWVTEIPDEIVAVETFIMTDLPSEASSAEGVYRLRYEGSGKLDLGGRGRILSYGDNEIWFHFTPGDDGLAIRISETDPEGSGDYIRNVTVIKEDNIPLYELGVLFNPEWIPLIEDLRLLRFMDWMNTNGAIGTTWDTRPVATDYTYVWRGVPLEVMIELVNQVGADPWFNLPHMADDAHARAFAEQVHQTLRPGLKAYIEFSNELWNFIFPQTAWAQQQAEERWETTENDGAWMQFAGVRSAEIMKIFTEVFADDPSRLVRVGGVHTGWPGLEEHFFEAELSEMRPAEFFDAYAVTGYFGHELGSADGASKLKAAITLDLDEGVGYLRATAKAVEILQEGSFTYLVEEAWPYHAKAAARYGLQLTMYEGGTHVVPHCEWGNDDALTGFFDAFNYSPAMAELYTTLLAEWTALGGTVFNAFVDVSKPTKWGSWGSLRYLRDENLRNDALQRFNVSGQGLADNRPASVFSNGFYLVAASSSATLTGTELDDVLRGSAGDDTLIANGGNDKIYGGDGVDHVVLPGFMEEYRFQRDENRLIALSKHGRFTMLAAETLAFTQLPELIVSIEDFF